MKNHNRSRDVKIPVVTLALMAVLYIGFYIVSATFEQQALVRLSARPVSNDLTNIIYKAALKNDLHPALVAAIIHAESNFNPNARSPRGAKGLMQINPPTERYLKVKNVLDPRENVFAGAGYLRELINTFGDMRLAIAAYNAGPGAVKRYRGIPPYRETRHYVGKVLKLYGNYKGIFVAYQQSF